MVAKNSYIEITGELRKTLLQHRERTGVGSSQLLRGKRREAPNKLTSSFIDNWMRGQSKSAKKEYWDYVLSLYEALPDDIWIPLKGRAKETLIERLDKASTSLNRLFVGRKDFPKGFSPQKIVHWRSNNENNINIRREWYEYVIMVCDELIARQDNAPKPSPMPYFSKDPALKPIDPDDLKKLKKYHNLTGLLPGLIFKHYKAPQGLNSPTITRWLSGQTTAANPDDVKWVIKSCEKLLKRALKAG